MNHTEAPLETLACPEGGHIAYRRLVARPGDRRPGVVFLTGFASDMSGGKASALAAWAAARGQGMLRFDYFGHGQSSGDFRDGTIGRWTEDALAVIDRLTAGPQILVGSSMGGWIMLLAALARADRIAGLVGIAAAPDFTEELMWGRMSAAQREALARDGVIQEPSKYADVPYEIGRALIEDGRRHLLLGSRIDIRCPVRLLHGMADPDVPWQTSKRLAEQLTSGDVTVTLIKDGDHRLSRDVDLQRLLAAVEELSTA